MHLKIVFGDLIEQNVDVIVNPWNRNIIPWWLLIPQGCPALLKREQGINLLKSYLDSVQSRWAKQC